MKLIERAAKRLEELRLAGFEVSDDRSAAGRWDGEPSADDGSNGVRPESASAKKAQTQSKLVELDLDAISSSGFVSPRVARSRLADEYRMIKRPLIDNALGRSAAPIQYGNLVMVTSALPGEGKTFTSINLAMSIAMELDSTVMLVDADVARPSVLNALGLPPAPGFLDVLLDDSLDLSDVLLKTNVERLTILPSGVRHDRVTELLASDAMATLLDEMSRRYSDRVIIFDSPPLLLATESPVLATHMGQIVVVVHAESTTQHDLQQALATIESCPVKLMLLNQARTSPRSAYGYGYGE